MSSTIAKKSKELFDNLLNQNPSYAMQANKTMQTHYDKLIEDLAAKEAPPALPAVAES